MSLCDHSFLSLISKEGTFWGNKRAGGADWPATEDLATSWLSVASLTVSELKHLRKELAIQHPFFEKTTDAAGRGGLLGSD